MFILSISANCGTAMARKNFRIQKTWGEEIRGDLGNLAKWLFFFCLLHASTCEQQNVLHDMHYYGLWTRYAACYQLRFKSPCAKTRTSSKTCLRSFEFSKALMTWGDGSRVFCPRFAKRSMATKMCWNCNVCVILLKYETGMFIKIVEIGSSTNIKTKASHLLRCTTS